MQKTTACVVWKRRWVTGKAAEDRKMDMGKEVKIEACTICAWRETCQKKFSISGKDLRCSDFSRDISIKGKKTESNESKVKQKDDLR